jgi:Flp pilus assembly protein TadD
MRKITYLFPLLLLSACENAGQPFDAQKFFSDLKMPGFAEKSPLTAADEARRDGRFDESITLYDKMLAEQPANVDAKEGKALALMAKGEFDSSGYIFDDIMKTDPTRWKTLNALGILFTTRNLQPEAQQYFREALKFSPDNAIVTNNIGLSQALEKRYENATESLQKAATSSASGSPAHKRIELNLALVYATSKKLPAANAIAAKYFTGPALTTNTELYTRIAGDSQLANAYINMALSDSKVFNDKTWENTQAVATLQ